MALLKCEDCGGEVSSRAQSCPHCGAPIESPQEPAALLLCPDCSTTVPADAEQCPSCGCATDSLGWTSAQDAAEAAWEPNMAGMNPGLTWLGTLAVVAALFGAYLYLFDTDEKREEANTPQQQAPVASVSAANLCEDYGRNEVAADVRYKGKLLEVRGDVTAIGNDLMDEPYITLDATDRVFCVQAMFPREHKGRLALLRKGTPVRVRCRCSGLMVNVMLRDCLLLR